MSRLGWIGILLRDTVSEFVEDNAGLFGAALAYYTLFSLAPILIIAVAIAGLVFEEQTAQNEIVAQMEALIGSEGALAIQRLIVRARDSHAGWIASIIGGATLLLGATRVFTNLRTALNVMWNAPTETRERSLKRGVVRMAKSRLLSFTIILVMGLLLLTSLLVSAALAVMGNHLASLLPEPAYLHLARLLNTAISFVGITLLLAAIYKLLPSVTIAWSDVWFGAMVTSLLFGGGKFLIGWYLGTSAVGSLFGAAGTFVVILIWVYYSSQILLFGAELTHVYATRFGSRRGTEGAAVAT